jgi:serine/threonine-protein kinase
VTAPISIPLTIESPDERTVVIDGRPAGVTPLALQLTDSMRSIRIERQNAKIPSAGAEAATAESQKTKAVTADGRVSINAVPWAQVSIDGKQIGDTPLGNVTVPVGEHEIVFRHPQLGERRRMILVKSGVLTRVSANFN